MIEKKLGERGFSDVKKKEREKRERKQGSRTSLNDALKRRKGEGRREKGREGGDEGDEKEGEGRTRRKRKGELQNDVFAMKRVD